MQKYYSLKVDSTDEDDIPIAKMGSKIISLHETSKPEKARKMITSDKYDILPLPFVPRANMNIRYFLCGTSGSGKSTLASKILEEYARMYPKQKIYIFSAIDHDPAYDDNKVLKNKIQRIDIRENLSDIEVQDFSNSFCVFDDCGSMNAQQHKMLQKLKDMILSTGRHSCVDSCVIRQDLLGGKESKADHMQSHFLGYFPGVGNDEELHYTFDKKYHYGKQLIKDKLMGGSSRWCVLHKHVPRYLIQANKVELL